MEITINEPAIWRSKDGDVNISNMTKDHLQKAYNSAEYRFMKYENLSINAAEKAALFENKLKQLESEAKTRQIELSSISSKSQEKFGILRNRKRVLAMG